MGIGSQHSDWEVQAVRTVAALMCLAARTAPKARGLDLVRTFVVEGELVGKLAEEMRKIGAGNGQQFYMRNADSLCEAVLVVLIGTCERRLGLDCGLCGCAGCRDAEVDGVRCVFNIHDLGVAVSAAASVAALHHVDNRVMFSVGHAALRLGVMGPEVKMAVGIPLSASGKNPFFDRAR